MKVTIKIPFAADGIEPMKRGTVTDLPKDLAMSLIMDGLVEPAEEPEKPKKRNTKIKA